MEDLLSTKRSNVSEFVPRSDDIYIVTYPRSGTTWLQMILYQLTTNGNMNFTHISQYIPWLERALLTGRRLNHLPSPRVFKTHWHLSKIKRWPGKAIYVYRDGKDVAVSYFHFYRVYLGFDGAFEEFFDLFLSGRVQYGAWFQHVRDARQYRSEPNTFFLKYENLIDHPDDSIKDIVKFCGLDATQEEYSRAIERSSFEFMSEHETKFDHSTEIWWERIQTRGRFMRSGKVGDWKNQLNSDQKAAFDLAAARYGLD